MRKEIITQKQAVSMVAMFIFGTSLVLGLSRFSKQDVWIAMLLSLAAMLPTLYIYVRLMKRYPGKNLFDICIGVFGKFFGRVFVLLFVWSAFHMGAMSLFTFVEFKQIRVFVNMPPIISLLLLSPLVIWCARRGVETLGRWSAVTLPIVLFIILATTALLIKDMKPQNLLPVGENLADLPRDAFANYGLPFAQIFLFLGLFDSLEKNGKPGKALLVGLLIGWGGLLISFFRNIMVLGLPLLGERFFPSYDAISIIIVGTVVSRIENIVGTNLLLCGFVKMTVDLIVAAKGFARLVGAEDYHPIVVPLGLLMAGFSMILFKNALEFFEFLQPYSYYLVFFELLLPLALCIGAEIKSIVKGKKDKGGAPSGPTPAEEL